MLFFTHKKGLTEKKTFFESEKTRPGRERPHSWYYNKKRPKHGHGQENPWNLAPHH
jgi:hypothetical protein